jgi:cytochrome c6
MNRYVALILAVLTVSAGGVAGCKKETEQKTEAPRTAPAPASTTPGTSPVTGEQLFTQFCAACHPDGGNIINPKKTLHAAVLADNRIKTSDDLLKILRNPGPGMRKFEPATISDNDAKLIYEYVAATFR